MFSLIMEIIIVFIPIPIHPPANRPARHQPPPEPATTTTEAQTLSPLTELVFVLLPINGHSDSGATAVKAAIEAFTPHHHHY